MDEKVPTGPLDGRLGHGVVAKRLQKHLSLRRQLRRKAASDAVYNLCSRRLPARRAPMLSEPLVNRIRKSSLIRANEFFLWVGIQTKADEWLLIDAN